MGMFKTRPTRKNRDEIANNEQETYFALKSNGLDDKTIAALMGNIRQEQSDFKFDSENDSGAYGLFQLKDVLRIGYEDYLKEFNQKDGIESQADYVSNIIKNNYEGSFGKPILGYGNTADLRKSFDEKGMLTQTMNFMDVFENPSDEEMELNKRFKYTKDYFNQIKKYYTD
jgi:hypothetical protein